MRKMLIALTLAAAAVAPTVATAQEQPMSCENNYLPDSGMWEITWGRQSEDDLLPTFTMESNGGLTSINGGPVPDYA